VKRRSPTRPFGFVRYRPAKASPYIAGFNPPGGGREVTKAFKTEAEADLWLAEQHVSVARFTFINSTGADTLLRDWWATWLAGADLRPTSRVTYESHGRLHILPVFGHRPIGSLRRSEINSWVNRLPLAPRTATTILAVLQSCLTAAVTDELIVKSNASGVKPPRVPRKPLVVPTADEVAAITKVMYGRYAVAVRLASEAGLRAGEVLGLRVEDLDLLRRRLVVSRQAQTLPGGVRVDLPPKSDAGYRTVPLAPETVDALALHLSTFPARDGLVVTSAPGRPVRRNLFGEAWTTAKQRADITRPLRFHDLRHRYASVLIEANVDALTIKTLMGHSSIQETFDTYGHLFPNQSERAAQAVTAAMSGASRTVSRTMGPKAAGQST
jgi:integrase